MEDIKNENFNNPQNLQSGNSYSTISATLNNPFVAKPIDYGDFRSADPVLNSILPKTINLGHDNGNANNGNDIFNGNKNFNLALTSPGTIDDSMKCTGLDYVNTNPDYDKLPFQVCLNKFNSQYQIPEIAFNNLMNNLPYTFSALSPEEKKRYLSSLQNFVDTQSTKNSIHINKKDNTNKIKEKNTVKEHFGSIPDASQSEGNCSSSQLSLSGILSIIIIVIIVLVFLVFICK